MIGDEADLAETVRDPAGAVSPINGVYVVRFGDNGIIGVTISGDFERIWGDDVFRAFETWVQENHPDDAEVMWRDGDVDSEILELFAENTRRFAENYERE